MGTPTRIMLAAFFTCRFGNINHEISYNNPDPFSPTSPLFEGGRRHKGGCAAVPAFCQHGSVSHGLRPMLWHVLSMLPKSLLLCWRAKVLRHWFAKGGAPWLMMARDAAWLEVTRPAFNSTGEPREKQVSHDLSRPRRLVFLRAPSPERSFPCRRQQTA